MRRRALLAAAGASVGTALAGCLALGGGPTEITDWHDLDAVRDNLDDDYRMTADLDENTAGYDEHVGNPDSGWEPIGAAVIESEEESTGRSEGGFTGRFDGDGHEIAGLQIKRPDQNRVGLFAWIYAPRARGKNMPAGAVADVTLDEVDIVGNHSVGSLAGLNWGEVRNATARGNVEGYKWVGGLVGYHSGREGITDTSADVEVTGRRTVGGLVGESGTDISGATARGNVAGEFSVGGLIGKVGGDHQVTESLVSGDVFGKNLVGGLIGKDEQGVQVSESVASGDVEGSDFVGGLLGSNEFGEVTRCIASGSVDAEHVVGGLVGKNQTVLKQSFATANVAGDERVGGLVGFNDGGRVTTAYWDEDATGQPEAIGHQEGEVVNVAGRTTTEMQGATAAETLSDLDFEDTWTTRTAPSGYPTLQWQQRDEQGDNDGTDDGGPGLGVGAALAGLGSAAYVLRRRAGEN